MKTLLCSLLLLVCSVMVFGQTHTGGGGGSQVAATATITDDTTTNATMYLTWVPTGAGTRKLYISTSNITWNPSTGTFTVAGPINATSISTGTAPTALGSATGGIAFTAADVEGNNVAGQYYMRAALTGTKFVFNYGAGVGPLNVASGGTGNTNGVGSAYTTVGSGSIAALSAANGPSQIVVCTATCDVTPVTPPAAKYQLCVYMAAGVTGTITLDALGNSAMYSKPDRSANGTAGTGTYALSSATGNFVCIVGQDATHYLTTAGNGTATVN